MMEASGELAAMRILKAIPVDYLVEHREEFIDIIERLDDSHADSSGGAFGLTPDNEAEFHEFTTWLRELGPLMDWPPTMSWALDVTFNEMAETFPHMHESAVAGPQPGSPVVTQLAERLRQIGPLKINEAIPASGGIRLTGNNWVFITGPDWRILNPDTTLAYSWTTPGIEEHVTDLIGLHIHDVTPQSRITTADPALHLSDDRRLEVFSGDPFRPWIMRIDAGTFTGAPTAPEWL